MLHLYAHKDAMELVKFVSVSALLLKGYNHEFMQTAALLREKKNVRHTKTLQDTFLYKQNRNVM